MRRGWSRNDAPWGSPTDHAPAVPPTDHAPAVPRVRQSVPPSPHLVIFSCFRPSVGFATIMPSPGPPQAWDLSPGAHGVVHVLSRSDVDTIASSETGYKRCLVRFLFFPRACLGDNLFCVALAICLTSACAAMGYFVHRVLFVANIIVIDAICCGLCRLE